MFCLIVFKNVLKAVVEYSISKYGVGVEAYFGSIMLNGFLTLPYQWHVFSQFSSFTVYALN